MNMLINNEYFLIFQLTTPRFPVVIKIGHAHSGMGKVINISFCFLSYTMVPCDITKWKGNYRMKKKSL